MGFTFSALQIKSGTCVRLSLSAQIRRAAGEIWYISFLFTSQEQVTNLETIMTDMTSH